MTNSVDQLLSAVGTKAMKMPCRIATVANITLNGEQSINGVSIVAGDRVLVKDQTDLTQNGVYVCSTGNWTRAIDFNENSDVVCGTLVTVKDFGVTSPSLHRTYYLNVTEPVVFGTSEFTFSEVFGTFNFSGLPDVSITSPAKNDIIVYDPSAWENIKNHVYPAELYGYNASGNTTTQNATGLQAALDAAQAAGGGLVTVSSPATVEGNIFIQPNTLFDNHGKTITVNNGGFRVDGIDNGAHVGFWEGKIDVIRTGTAGPAIFLGGDDTPGSNKGAIRGRLYPIVRGSTGVGIQLSNAYIIDIFHPSVRDCDGSGWLFDYGPQTVTSANAVTIIGGETQQCLRGYEMIGVSGIFWVGHIIEGNSNECIIKTSARDITHFGGYTELNGTTGYDFIIGDATGSPANINFTNMIFYDGSGGNKTHAIKAVKCDGLHVSNCRLSGYTNALVDFQPISGAAVKGSWSSIIGQPATDGAVNKHFRAADIKDAILTGTTTWDIPSLGAGALSTTTLTVTGAATGDFVIGSYTGGFDDVVVTYQVSAADTVEIRAVNAGTVTRDPSNTTFRVMVIPFAYLI